MKPRPTPANRTTSGARQPGPVTAFNPNRPFASATDEARVPIVREIGAAADYLRCVRLELAALGANELAKDRIPAAGRELEDIIEDGGEFSNAIMSAVEDVTNAGEMEPDAFRALVAERMTTIIVQCAFQDITNQRAKRIRSILDLIERRLARLATFVATRDMPDIVDFSFEDAEAPTPPQAGPAPRGAGNAQDAIDRILAGSDPA